MRTVRCTAEDPGRRHPASAPGDAVDLRLEPQPTGGSLAWGASAGSAPARAAACRRGCRANPGFARHPRRCAGVKPALADASNTGRAEPMRLYATCGALLSYALHAEQLRDATHHGALPRAHQPSVPAAAAHTTLIGRKEAFESSNHAVDTGGRETHPGPRKVRHKSATILEWLLVTHA